MATLFDTALVLGILGFLGLILWMRLMGKTFPEVMQEVKEGLIVWKKDD